VHEENEGGRKLLCGKEVICTKGEGARGTGGMETDGGALVRKSFEILGGGVQKLQRPSRIKSLMK